MKNIPSFKSTPVAATVHIRAHANKGFQNVNNEGVSTHYRSGLEVFARPELSRTRIRSLADLST